MNQFKPMHRHLNPLHLLLPLALVLSLAWLLTGCGGDQGAREEQLYTCGMHPQVIQNKPGNCPICGMKLTPVRKQAGPGPAATNTVSTAITIDPATVQKMDVRTGVVTRGPLRRVVRTVGVIDFDETALAEVSTKFRGWVEKLYVDSTGKQMHRGDPLFEIYSPELYMAQTEYLLTLNALTNHEGAAPDPRQSAALTKLRYWDISEDQIAELERTRTAKKTLRINAPRDGIVVEKMVVEGQMVEAGMKLYRLADLATVWIQAQVYEQDLPFVRLGQEAVVSLASLPDPKFRGRVTYIYPIVDEKTRTARVRMEFHNPGYFLKPGMYATVELSSDTRALRAAGARHGGPPQRRKEYGLRRAGWRQIRAPHRGHRRPRRRQHLPGPERAERGRARRHLRPIHARFRKPATRGHPENARPSMRKAPRASAET